MQSVVLETEDKGKVRKQKETAREGGRNHMGLDRLRRQNIDSLQPGKKPTFNPPDQECKTGTGTPLPGGPLTTI